MVPQVKIDDVLKELSFTASKSSGPGGQHVNKVNTKVTLKWDIGASGILSPDQKQRLLEKLKSKLSSGHVLLLSSQSERSQLRNKDAVISKLEELLTEAFQRIPVRRPTKPTKSSVKKRLTKKRKQAEKKILRRKI